MYSLSLNLLGKLAIQALDTLVADAINRTKHTAGFEYANRLLDLDPWRESAHRQMMILPARSGRRDAALVQYETCRQILANELGVEPMPETTALYERLKDASTAPPHNLPPSPNSFVGRERELAFISGQLARPESRLVTLVGPGGIGKTRLALETARGFTQPESRLIEPNFADGIYLVALASIRAGQELTGSKNRTGLFNTITSAIAEAIGLTLRGLSELQVQLLHHLQAKAMLLIFDNFEHLLTGLARACLAHQDLKQARTHTEALLPHLGPNILCGMRETFRIHLTCYHVLRAGEDPRAGEVLATAYRQLHERAAHIEDEVLRRSFLEHIPHHREIVREFKG